MENFEIFDLRTSNFDNGQLRFDSAAATVEKI